MTELFLGVDGGQSSTTALIGDETGRVIGAGRGGPCNHVESGDGRQKFVNAMEGSIGAACASAGLEMQAVTFESACLGFSGGPADKQQILEQMLRADRMVVTHDGLIALAGATAGEPGIIVIAGTGSFSFGRNARGETARAGGWGYLFGDEGGAFDLTRQALRAALRQEEGWGPPTVLRQALLEATGANDANDLLHRFYTIDFPRPRIAAFARLVDEAAIAGDGVAQKLVQDSAYELAMIASAVRNRLFAATDPVCVAYVGNVFRSAMLLERFRTILEIDEQVRVTAPVYGPAAGALIEAYRAAGRR
ncbi:MAG: hypothetical protein JO022_18190, partial [Acidobacteriaceae bacterium]|nr:hypothetical protein [Acidobacteriaceae bacterium]